LKKLLFLPNFFTMAFIKSMLLPIMVYLVTVGAETRANLLKEPIKVDVKVDAKYEDLIYQSMKSIVSLDELVTTLSVQVAHLTTSLSNMQVDLKKIGEQNVDLSAALTKVNDRITKESAGVTTALKKVNDRITKESAALATAIKTTESDLKITKAGIANMELSLIKGIADTEKDVGNVKTEIEKLKNSDVVINGKFEKLDDQVAVVSVEQGSNNGKCEKVCAGTTGRSGSIWHNYSSSGIYMDVDISSCGYTRVPTITTAIEGTSSHWKATGTSSIYSATPSRFRIYIHTGGLRIGRAKTYKYNVEWIAVGHTC